MEGEVYRIHVVKIIEQKCGGGGLQNSESNQQCLYKILWEISILPYSHLTPKILATKQEHDIGAQIDLRDYKKKCLFSHHL